MTEVNSKTASSILALLQDGLIIGNINGSDHLILTARDSGTVDAGLVLDLSDYIDRLEDLEPDYATNDGVWIYIGSGLLGAPNFASGISNWGAGYQEARYQKDRGIVRFAGLVKLSVTTATQTLFTLPTAYRPTSSLIFPSVANTVSGPASTGTAHTHTTLASGCRLQVNSDGTVVAYSGSGLFASSSYVSLDSVLYGLD